MILTKLSKTLSCLKHSARLFSNSKDFLSTPDAQINEYISKGLEIVDKKKDFLSAEEHFDKGLKIAYELYPLAFKKILKILERILFAFKTSQNDLNSIKYLKQALDIQTSEKNDQKMHELNIEIGKKYYNSNDYENADFYLSKSISFYKFPIIQEKALTLKMLSEVNAMLNNNEKALCFIYQGIEILTRSKTELVLLVDFYGTLAIIYQSHSQFIKAKKYWLKALKILEESGQMSQISMHLSCYKNLGIVSEALGEFKSCVKTLIKATCLIDDQDEKLDFLLNSFETVKNI